MKKKIEVKPLPGTILVEVEEAKSEGGIILPDSANETEPGKTYPDVVIASGISSIKVGETVVYVRWGKPKVKTGEKIYVVLKEEEILAKLVK